MISNYNFFDISIIRQVPGIRQFHQFSFTSQQPMLNSQQPPAWSSTSKCAQDWHSGLSPHPSEFIEKPKNVHVCYRCGNNCTDKYDKLPNNIIIKHVYRRMILLQHIITPLTQSCKSSYLESSSFVESHDYGNPLKIPKHIIYRRIYSKTGIFLGFHSCSQNSVKNSPSQMFYGVLTPPLDFEHRFQKSYLKSCVQSLLYNFTWVKFRSFYVKHEN